MKPLRLFQSSLVKKKFYSIHFPFFQYQSNLDRKKRCQYKLTTISSIIFMSKEVNISIHVESY
ncbi:hypothetical protein AC790_18500 [Pantoea sp. RIT-PI-b]|nr:hypothetical protein AC790_18500 [Pantoea sp. RIT-PI-b]